MVNKRSMGGLFAAFAMFLAFPALASAHILAVSAGPSQCVSPLDGSYTATITVTETYFSGTTENIPVGQNVRELSTSTDTGNKGLNQNYFTTSSVGTQTGTAGLGQPVSFTSPASGGAATKQFTITVAGSTTETYVLGNSYMGTPSSVTVRPPSSNCTPPPPTVSATATTQCTAALNGTFTATIDVRSSGAFAVPAGASGGAGGTNEFSPAASGQPSSFNSGDTTFTVGGLTRSTVYTIGSPGGNVATVTLAVPSSGCTPPPPTVSVTATTQCTAALNGTFTATIDVRSSGSFTVPAGASGGAGGTNGFIPAASGQPSSFNSGDTTFTVGGLTQSTLYAIAAPGGNVATVTLAAPASGCTPSCPPGDTLSGGQCTPPTSCPSGETLSGGQCMPPSGCPSGESYVNGQCVPPTDCPTGSTMTANGCALPAAVVVPAAATFPAVCRASTKGYKVRAGQQDTVIVSVDRHGAPVAGATVRLTLPGGKVLTKAAGTNGTATFHFEPPHSGTILVRSPSCTEMVKVKVFAAKAATAVRAPSFTG